MIVDVGNDLTFALTESTMSIRRKGNRNQFLALSAQDWYQILDKMNVIFGVNGPYPVVKKDLNNE
jgi:hypothetical protein